MKALEYILIVSILSLACSTDKKDQFTNGTDSLSYYMGVFTALKLKAAGYSDFNYNQFEDAMTAGFASNDGMQLRVSDSIISFYFKKSKQQEFSQTLEESRIFFEENKNKQGMHTTLSGLQYEIFKEGNGQRPRLGDSIVFHYVATTTEGVEFINSYRNNSPVGMELKNGTPGGLEAFLLMSEGSQFRFYIPPLLAYGEKSDPAGIIKPYSSIIYTVELFSIIPQCKQ